MILDLIKRLFLTSKPINPSMPTAQNKQSHPKTSQTAAVNSMPKCEQSDFDPLSLATSFNDFLLGAQTGDSLPPNDSERFIVSGLEHMLRNKIPDSAVPRLPEVAMALLKELTDPGVTQEIILSYINRDPALASEVLLMSNSASFRTSDGEENINLDKAVVLLGLNNLKYIVSSALMKQVMLISPIYFRMFGQHLWQHSLDCAHACHALSKLYYDCADPNNAYLVGLMHDVGKLAIFNLLTQSLKGNINAQPRGSVFSYVVRDNSQLLSAKIARDWSLPDFLLIALDEQIETTSIVDRSIYGSILSHANTLAEFKVVAEIAVKSNESFNATLEKYSISQQLFTEVFPKDAEALLAGIA